LFRAFLATERPEAGAAASGQNHGIEMCRHYQLDCGVKIVDCRFKFELVSRLVSLLHSYVKSGDHQSM
jgi:hypothetical protein